MTFLLQNLNRFPEMGQKIIRTNQDLSDSVRAQEEVPILGIPLRVMYNIIEPAKAVEVVRVKFSKVNRIF